MASNMKGMWGFEACDQDHLLLLACCSHARCVAGLHMQHSLHKEQPGVLRSVLGGHAPVQQTHPCWHAFRACNPCIITQQHVVVPMIDVMPWS